MTDRIAAEQTLVQPELGVRAPANSRRASRSLLSAIKKHSVAYLFILPSFVTFLVFTLYPVIDTVVFSFQNLVGGQAVWAGLANYRAMFSDAIFLSSAKNTVWYLLYMVPFGIALSLFLAGLISSIPSLRMQKLFKAAFYLPIATVSTVMLSLIWIYMYDPSYGVINYVLGQLGIPAQPWLSSPHTALISLVIMMQTQWWGGMIILLTASIGSIPSDLYEASRVDGASRIRHFVSVTVPLIRPALAYVAIMGTISSFRIFNEIDLMTQGGPSYSTGNLAYDIYQTGIGQFNFGEAAAISTVLLGITMLVAIVQYRIIHRSIQY